MIWVLLTAAFIAGGVVTGGAVNWWNETVIARKEAALQAAQKKVADAAAEAEATAADHLVDMTAAYAAGEANAKPITEKIYIKGKNIVDTTPAFSNPACVAGDDALKLLNGARAGSGLQLAADTGGADATVPGSGPAAGRKDGDALSGAAAGRGAVPNVQPPPSGTGSGDQVPGTSARGVPKNPLAK